MPQRYPARPTLAAASLLALLAVSSVPAYAITATGATVGTYSPRAAATSDEDALAQPAQVDDSATPADVIARGGRRARRGGVRKLLGKLRAPEVRNPKAGPGAGLAVAGLVCGIVGLFVFGVILGPLAAVFGAISLSKYNKGLHGRKGMAIAAIILGAIATLGAIIVIAAMPS